MNNKIILNIISFILAYIIFLLIYIFIINRKRKDYKNGKKQAEISYIINKSKLDMRKTKYNTLKWAVTFINPFIISVTFIIVTNIESYLIGIIVGFITLLLLVYSCYEILGRYLKKKEGKKNV